MTATTNRISDELAGRLDEIEEQGYTIIEGALDPEFTAELREAVRSQFTEVVR